MLDGLQDRVYIFLLRVTKTGLDWLRSCIHAGQKDCMIDERCRMLYFYEGIPGLCTSNNKSAIIIRDTRRRSLSGMSINEASESTL